LIYLLQSLAHSANAGQLFFGLRREAIYVDEVYICELCLQAYEPEEVVPGGIRKLKEFKGYTVDLRLRQFRKVPYDKLPEFIDFDSPGGKRLLAQMHEAATR
jgi:hypothetical protein